MKKYLKYPIHFVLFVALQLIIAFVVIRLSLPEAEAQAATADGPFGLVVLMSLIILNIVLLVPLISTFLYWVSTKITARSPLLKLKLLEKIVIVFLASVFVLGSYFVISTIEVNNSMRQVEIEQTQLMQQYFLEDPQFFNKNGITQTTPQEQAENIARQRGLDVMTQIFNLIITVVYGIANIVIFLVFEGVAKLIVKLRSKR